ncbi:polysaccharide deacetylase family protein [Hymenobacter sp. BT683]|uniref:Polysaccharide deacetylase family protein n=1 Tax=Hymenobacter jeongseonensis TaxID=2791027 RepID=A0ABS0IFQ6_9BACT|nr:polysaccharide deacetylase family protein [Hymenobacter jeongseonensis]MBF9237193.1 polysaccharide deacetylase family protein [Hymenobacter jeongseonensis]
MRARLDAALLTRPPRLLHTLLPGCEWTGPHHTASGTPVVYLTFDDGPIPEETPWVLEQLAAFNARATFFCVGENLARYPAIARATLAAGHRLGNHTHRHRSAWASTRADYLQGIADCQAELSGIGLAHPGELTSPDLLFRPPHGRLTWPLLQALRLGYRVAMWSVLTRDYDPDLSPENCLRFTLAAVRAGDIVVFHDSHKASARLRFVLPRLLAHLAGQGFGFAVL